AQTRRPAALLDCPVGMVCDLPRVAVGIDEDPRVAAPEGLARLAPNAGGGLAGLLDHLVDLVGRARGVGEGDSAPDAPRGDRAVLGQLDAVPEGNHHAPRLEEDTVVSLLCAALPAERLIELAGAGQVRDSERDQAETLFHECSFPSDFGCPLS